MTNSLFTNKNFIKVLFIDDNDIDLLIARKIVSLIDYNIIVETKRSVFEAISYLEELRSEEKPDIIFLDLYLPEKNGWHYLNALEKQPGLISPDCEIYILSSSVKLSEYKETKKSRFVTGYYSKPFTADMIKKIIAR